MSRRDDIERLIAENYAHLQKLREQQASFGLYTPAHISIEIEKIEAEIERLQTELDTLSEINVEDVSKSIGDIPKQRVQIYLQGDFSSLSHERRSIIIDALAGMLRIPPQVIEMYSVYPGSIVFDLGIPRDAVQRLRLLLQSNDGKLHQLEIEKVIIFKESGEVEEAWVIKEEKFTSVLDSGYILTDRQQILSEENAIHPSRPHRPTLSTQNRLMQIFTEFASKNEIPYQKIAEDQIEITIGSNYNNLNVVIRIQSTQDSYEYHTAILTVPPDKRGEIAEAAISEPFREVSPVLPPNNDRLFIYGSRTGLLNKAETEIRDKIFDDMRRIAEFDNEKFPIFQDLLFGKKNEISE